MKTSTEFTVAGWTRHSFLLLIERLADRGKPHAAVMLTALEQDGFVGRGAVLRASGRLGRAGLRGWLSAVSTEMLHMQQEGLLSWHASAPLVAERDEHRGAVCGYRISKPLVALALGES